ncbi:hypothetical protein SERLA73DRAFT_186146, partial [Serpula lacrymans var. lacrymans S7.3]
MARLGWKIARAISAVSVQLLLRIVRNHHLKNPQARNSADESEYGSQVSPIQEPHRPMRHKSPSSSGGSFPRYEGRPRNEFWRDSSRDYVERPYRAKRSQSPSWSSSFSRSRDEGDNDYPEDHAEQPYRSMRPQTSSRSSYGNSYSRSEPRPRIEGGRDYSGRHTEHTSRPTHRIASSQSASGSS